MSRAIHPVMVGTAGHIDHGKSTLVRALTGVDRDEELRGRVGRAPRADQVRPGRELDDRTDLTGEAWRAVAELLPRDDPEALPATEGPGRTD